MHSVIPRWPPMLGRSPLWCIVCVLLVQSPACFPFYSLRIARSTKGTNVAICDVHDSLVRSLLPLCSRSPSMMPKMPPRGAMRHHRSSAAKPRAYVHGTNSFLAALSSIARPHMCHSFANDVIPGRVRVILAGSPETLPEGSRIHAVGVTQREKCSISREGEEQPHSSRYLSP